MDRGFFAHASAGGRARCAMVQFFLFEFVQCIPFDKSMRIFNNDRCATEIELLTKLRPFHEFYALLYKCRWLKYASTPE